MPAPIRLGCLLLLSLPLTACTAPPPRTVEVPVEKVVKVMDPPECLVCRPLPVEAVPLSKSTHQVDDLVRLLAALKAAYADCAAKLQCVAKFQAEQTK